MLNSPSHIFSLSLKVLFRFILIWETFEETILNVRAAHDYYRHNSDDLAADGTLRSRSTGHIECSTKSLSHCHYFDCSSQGGPVSPGRSGQLTNEKEQKRLFTF